jgi:hypothetical protein
MGDADIHLERLLAEWKGDRAQRTALYRALREPMYQAARRGIGLITASNPDPQDVENAVYVAFLEFERMLAREARIRSPKGMAKTIALCRGKDIGRKVIASESRSAVARLTEPCRRTRSSRATMFVRPPSRRFCWGTPRNAWMA